MQLLDSLMREQPRAFYRRSPVLQLGSGIDHDSTFGQQSMELARPNAESNIFRGEFIELAAGSLQIKNQMSAAELIQLLFGGETGTLPRADSKMSKEGHLDSGVLLFEPTQTPVRRYPGKCLWQNYRAEARL